MTRTITYATRAGWVVAAAIVALFADPPGTPLARQSDAGPSFTLPAGFEVERVAGPPLVDRPIVADFDEEGRLYVADSSGSNDRVERQIADRPHRIVRLEDTNGDGRFDRSVVFADRMMLPEGTMWLDGSLYVAAPPSIWKLTDTNDDGVADRREEWFRGETLTSCANDLHGPYLGVDGWIYWTKGAFAQQTYERIGQPALVTRAAHIFRRRPGDPSIDVVMTGGMDNPVDVAFTAAGERILSATFLNHPQAGRRDGLVHAIYGGVYGKPHAAIDGHARTGELMPVMSELGPAVPAGLTRYASRVFGAGYRESFFAAMFNLRKVTRHVLVPAGATFVTRDSDFLVSDSRDFHPTDVIEDADGSLLVIDTGPWYKLCCPTSQLARPEVFGAIYRVRRNGGSTLDDPRGRKLAWASMTPADLVRLLDEPRPAVQSRALQMLGTAGQTAVAPLADVLRRSRSAEARRNAVWALARIDGALAREAVRLALDDRDDSVRQAAAHSAGLWRDERALPQLVRALGGGRPALQRAAAEALGRVGRPEAIPALLSAAAASVDRVLEHSLTYALIEIGDPASIAAGTQAAASRTKRAALIALDQIGGGVLKPEGVVPLLDSPDAVLRDTAWWIAGRHLEWGQALAGSFQHRLATARLTGAEVDDLQRKVLQFVGNSAIQALLAEAAGDSVTTERRLIALQMMAAAASPNAPAAVRLKELPATWIGPLSRAIADGNDAVTEQAVAVARGAPASQGALLELRAALDLTVRNGTRTPEVRLNALAALTARGGVPIDSDLFELLRASLEPASAAHLRTAGAAVIEKTALDRTQLLALTRLLTTAGPLELPRLLQAFDHGKDEALGLALIAALDQSAARAALRAEILRPRLANYPASVRAAGERLLASVHVDLARQAQRLEELMVAVQGGDVARGQTVFNSTKAACLTCHAIGYLGGRIGPDLTRIGQVRSDRDLLEAVVFPNVSFARGYEPVLVRTKSGQMHGGLLRSETADEIVISDAASVETRLLRKDIADIQSGTASLMPAGYGELLTRQELADLLAFLKAAR
jgi:putative membrane-bound dehydrogenase-like protein